MGTSIGLNLIEGTRALVGWIHEAMFEIGARQRSKSVVTLGLSVENQPEDEQDLGDGWISFVRLDGSPTLRRVLEEFRV